MKAQELRIGNWVDRDGKLYRILSGYGLLTGAVAKYKPIPLTPEILEKCGFEKREQGVCNCYYIPNSTISMSYQIELVWLKDIINGKESGFPFYRNAFCTVKYLHQLQNLYFALTGEELDFKP